MISAKSVRESQERKVKIVKGFSLVAILFVVVFGGLQVYNKNFGSTDVALDYPADKKAYDAYNPPTAQEGSSEVAKQLERIDLKTPDGKIAAGNIIASSQQSFNEDVSNYLASVPR